jgi:hypothetical protein
MKQPDNRLQQNKLRFLVQKIFVGIAIDVTLVPVAIALAISIQVIEDKAL